MSRHTDAIAGYKARLIRRISNLNPALANELKGIELSWYTIRNESDADPNQGDVPDDQAEILIYDEIGGSLGVNAEEFVRDLSNIKSPNIKLRINSPGGSLFDSIAIYNALVQHPAYVTTYVDALAASGAGIVALAGNRVIMMPGSQMMIHDALGMEMGNARDMQAMSTFLDRQSNNIADIYANKAGGNPDDWRDKMLAETWLFAQEAVDSGLADEVFQINQTESEEEEGKDKDKDKDMPMRPKEDEEEEDAKDLEALMNVRHSLRNRGYKHPGREFAPKPTAKKTTTATATNIATFREILSAK